MGLPYTQSRPSMTGWLSSTTVSPPLRLEVAIGTANTVIGIQQIVLHDPRDAIVGREDQILVQQGNAELPARGQFQLAAQVHETFIGLGLVLLQD